MQVDRRPASLGGIEQRCELRFIEVMPTGMGVDHDAVQAERPHHAFDLVRRGSRILRADRSEARKAEEANVTRAAVRLSISQPALSAQLARLRLLIGDPLLVPSETGRGMVATTHAIALRHRLHAALEDLRAAVRPPSLFDPLIETRTFTIAATDYAAIVLGLALVERLLAGAGPGIRIRIRDLQATSNEALERGDVDLLIGADKDQTEVMPVSKLLDERYVMIQRKGHPRGTHPLDLGGYCLLKHVLVSPFDGDLRGLIDEQLAQLGHHRDVVLAVHQFALAPMIVERGDFVSTLPERLARRFADRVDLFELPFPAREFSLFTTWHPRSHQDQGHVWLRRQLAVLAKGDGGPGT